MISGAELATRVLERTRLIHRKVDVAIVEKCINDTRISNRTAISDVLVALARNLMSLAFPAMILLLQMQAVAVIINHGLTLVHIRYRRNRK